MDIHEPWNSPKNMAALGRRPQETHAADLYFRGPALSYDGKLMAVTLPSSPVNEVAIIDVAARSGWLLAHPNRFVKLAHPSFSPDGRHLALVVTPPTYFGASEIWIAPLEGGAAQVIRERPMGCFMVPRFSQDGERLVCFGDANQAIDDRFERFDPSVPRSYLTGTVQLALYEIMLRTGAITRLAKQAWGSVRFVYYGPRDEGFYLSTGAPSTLVQTANGEVWKRPEYGADASMYVHGFYIERGQEPTLPPPSVLPRAIVEQNTDPGSEPRLAAVGANGELLIKTFKPDARSPAETFPALILCRADRCEDALAPDLAHVQEVAMSGDAQTFAGRIPWRMINGARVSGSTYEHHYIVRHRDQMHEFVAPNEIQFDERRRILAAGGPSELAS